MFRIAVCAYVKHLKAMAAIVGFVSLGMGLPPSHARVPGATEMEVIAWQATPESPRVLLPAFRGELPARALQRYLSRVNAIRDARRMRPANGFAAPTGRVSLLLDSDLQALPSALSANRFDDMLASGARIQRNLSLHRRLGADPYVIGLAAEYGLTQTQIEAFWNRIAEAFSVIQLLGGADNHPRTYGQEVRFVNADELSYVVDALEIGRARYFLRTGRVMVTGICKGHQALAVAAGHALYQDLSGDGVCETSDHINRNARGEGDNPTALQTWHDIEMMPNTPLARLLAPYAASRGGQVRVNSVHHQAVQVSSGGRGEVAAVDPRTGLVEAMVYHDARGRWIGVSTQFHPEFPVQISGNPQFSRMGEHLFEGIFQAARTLKRQIGCESQMRAQ